MVWNWRSVLSLLHRMEYNAIQSRRRTSQRQLVQISHILSIFNTRVLLLSPFGQAHGLMIERKNNQSRSGFQERSEHVYSSRSVLSLLSPLWIQTSIQCSTRKNRRQIIRISYTVSNFHSHVFLLSPPFSVDLWGLKEKNNKSRREASLFDSEIGGTFFLSIDTCIATFRIKGKNQSKAARSDSIHHFCVRYSCSSLFTFGFRVGFRKRKEKDGNSRCELQREDLVWDSRSVLFLLPQAFQKSFIKFEGNPIWNEAKGRSLRFHTQFLPSTRVLHLSASHDLHLSRGKLGSWRTTKGKTSWEEKWDCLKFETRSFSPFTTSCLIFANRRRRNRRQLVQIRTSILVSTFVFFPFERVFRL